MSSNRYAKSFFWISAVLWAGYLSGFFYNLHSTLSDYSWGDIAYHYQVFYNFLHHRPMQTSLYFNPHHGVIANPFAYASQTAIHVNFTPFLFVPLFALWPSIYGLYALIISVNFLSLWAIARSLLRGKSSQDYADSMKWVMASCLSGSFLFVTQAKGHFLLFSTPFICLSFYALWNRQKALFMAAIILLCGVSEDSALFGLSLAAYIFLFERDRRPYAYAAGIYSFIYLVLAIGILQPAARWGMTVEHSTHILFALKTLPSAFLIKQTVVCSLPLLFFFPAFWTVREPFFSSSALPRSKFLGLLFVAPAAHWFIQIVDPAEQHLAPVMTCMVIALALDIAHREPERQTRSGTRRTSLLILFYIGCNALVMRRDMVYSLKEHLRESMARFKSPHTEYCFPAVQNQRVSNKVLLEAIRVLPATASMTYWTNRSLDGFLAARTDVWRFPDYFDQSEYLVIEKKAAASWFKTEVSRNHLMAERLRGGTFHSSGDDAAIDPALVGDLAQDLVQRSKSHRIIRDDSEILILQRLHPLAFVMPESTVGLGWLKNIPAVLGRMRS